MIRTNTQKLIVLLNDPVHGAIRFEMDRHNVSAAHYAVLQEMKQALVRLVQLPNAESQGP